MEDTIQHKPAWADGCIVPSVDFTLPGEVEGDTEDRYTQGYRDCIDAIKEVMRRTTFDRNPKKIGRRMLVIVDKLERAVSAKTASELGMSRQAWQKYHQGVEKLLPIGGIMSPEQRARMAAGKKRGRRGVKLPPATQLEGVTNQSEQKPYTDKDIVNGGQNL